MGSQITYYAEVGFRNNWWVLSVRPGVRTPADKIGQTLTKRHCEEERRGNPDLYRADIQSSRLSRHIPSAITSG
jgi:hypothetical protein